MEFDDIGIEGGNLPLAGVGLGGACLPNYDRVLEQRAVNFKNY